MTDVENIYNDPTGLYSLSIIMECVKFYNYKFCAKHCFIIS